MPLIESKSKKAFKKNVETEMNAGKPQDKSLAIAYAVKRKPKKMAKGGPVSAKSEKRPMPDQIDNDAPQADMASNKPSKNDSWTDRSTVAQAQRPSRTPLKHPKMVPSDAFSVRLRSEEDDLQRSAGVNDGPQRQPPEHDNEMEADKLGPKVPDMQPEHNNHRKPYAEGGSVDEESTDDDSPEHMEVEVKRRHPASEDDKYAKGGKINDFENMHDAEEDEVEHPAGLESDNDMMKPEESEYMGKNWAAGGSVESGSPDMNFADGGMIDDEEDMEHDASIAGAIMRRRKMADGGILSHDSIYSDNSDQADISRNADEDANEEDQLSFNALRKENYNESEGLAKMDSPMDSNEHGHKMSDEDAHDLVGKIRKLMKSRSPITK